MAFSKPDKGNGIFLMKCRKCVGWMRVGFHAASCRRKPQTAIHGGLPLGYGAFHKKNTVYLITALKKPMAAPNSLSLAGDIIFCVLLICYFIIMYRNGNGNTLLECDFSWYEIGNCGMLGKRDGLNGREIDEEVERKG